MDEKSRDPWAIDAANRRRLVEAGWMWTPDLGGSWLAPGADVGDKLWCTGDALRALADADAVAEDAP